MQQQPLFPLSALACCALSIWSVTANALPEVPDEKWRIAGNLNLGGGVVRLESNTVSGNGITGIPNNPISTNDLVNAPRGRSGATPVAVNEFSWNFGNRNELFVGETVENAVTFDRGSQMGWRKTFENAGTIEVSGVFNRLVPTDVYEDSFLTGEKRKETEATRIGGRFQWDKIFGSEFEVQLTFRDINIDTDNNGQSLVIGDPGNPQDLPTGVNLITRQQQQLLRRDASEVFTRVSYEFTPGQRHSIRPLIGYSNRSADGDAESFDALRAQVTYKYMSKAFVYVANAVLIERKYDARNPIYDEFRDSTSYLLDSTIFVPLKFGSGNWGWFANATWGQEDSKINFYNQKALRVVTGFQLKFEM